MRLHILMCGFAPLAFLGCQKPAPPPPPPSPAAVQFVYPVEAAVTPYEEFGGRAVSSETVELKARVTGYLEKVNFVDGAEVKQGDVLFEIEDDTYLAEFAEAVATVKQREADVKRLQTQLDRLRRLKQSEATTQQEIDRLTFEVDAAAAGQAAAVAMRDRAKLNVEFTKVTAPISGQIGRRLVDPGNLVQADNTSLGVIVSLNPIYAYFEYDERSVLAMRRMVDQGVLKEAPDREQIVGVAPAGETRYDLSGRINWVDNQIDMGTGTLRARVEVANDRRLLTPGMFVRMKVPLGPEQKALLIPEQALVADQGNRFVYVVTDTDEIEYRSIEVGWQEGEKRVITSGLSATDRVVLTGLQRIRAKSKVTAKPWTPPDTAAAGSSASTSTSKEAGPTATPTVITVPPPASQSANSPPVASPAAKP